MSYWADYFGRFGWQERSFLNDKHLSPEKRFCFQVLLLRSTFLRLRLLGGVIWGTKLPSEPGQAPVCRNGLLRGWQLVPSASGTRRRTHVD